MKKPEDRAAEVENLWRARWRNKLDTQSAGLTIGQARALLADLASLRASNILLEAAAAAALPQAPGERVGVEDHEFVARTLSPDVRQGPVTLDLCAFVVNGHYCNRPSANHALPPPADTPADAGGEG